jgi:hypothetical protein
MFWFLGTGCRDGPETRRHARSAQAKLSHYRKFLFGPVVRDGVTGSFDCVAALLRCAATPLRMTKVVLGRRLLRRRYPTLQSGIRSEYRALGEENPHFSRTGRARNGAPGPGFVTTFFISTLGDS